MTAVLTGILAGILHVMQGPDHLAAIAPLSLRHWKKAWVIGIHWGLGHASGVLFVGLCSLLLRDFVSVESISGIAERFVGVVLIGIGLWGLRQSLKNRIHVHEHSHDGTTHSHIHVHGARHAPGQSPKALHEHGHAAFGIGSIHGLAGGSHLFGVLPALLFASKTSAVAYLVAYGAGTVCAMAIFAWGMGILSQRFSMRTPFAYRWLSCGFSIFAIALGGYWIVG